METIAQEESTWRTECIIGAGRRLPGEKAGPQHTELGALLTVSLIFFLSQELGKFLNGQLKVKMLLKKDCYHIEHIQPKQKYKNITVVRK